MSEILIDSLVGSVEDLQKKTDEIEGKFKALPDHSEPIKTLEGRVGAAEKEIQEMPGKIFMPLPEILGLTHALQHHSRLLGIPMKQEVCHEHHITKPIIVCIVLSLVVIALLFLEYSTWFIADQHKANDLKYRYLEVFASSEGHRAYIEIDSVYRANPEEFRTIVIKQETIELERFQDYKRMQENREEIKNLQDKWNRLPNKRPN
jgi:hypothetical protein